MKIKVDKLDVYKLIHIPVDSKKPTDVVEKRIVKKTIHNELVQKIVKLKRIY